MRRTPFLALFILLLSRAGLAAEPFRYPEGKQGRGELRYHRGIPVLTVAGTPEEIGEQIGSLTAAPLKRLTAFPRELLEKFHVGFLMPQLVRLSNGMLPQFPSAYRRELNALAKYAGVNQDLAVLGNTMPDLLKLAGCSTLIVEPSRSAAGGPLFGRNLDYPTLGFLHEYTLVTVYRPDGKHAFASVGFPGMVGCLSGMNDAGLAVATLEVYTAADGSAKLDPEGTPYTLAIRRVLEECATVVEAEKLLRSIKRTTMNNLAVCDRSGGAVFEITPTNVIVRPAANDLCACTNHFRTKKLAGDQPPACRRYDALLAKPTPKLGLADVARRLDAANQGSNTLQTMIFEPATLTLHLAFGKTPSSSLPLRRLELAPLLQGT